MKKVILIGLLLTVQSAYAGDVLNQLKKVPANQYQIAMVYLELNAYAATKELKGRQIPDLDMEFDGVSVKHEGQEVYMQFSATAQAKDLTNAKCIALKNKLTKIGVINGMTTEIDKEIWGESSEATLQNDIILKVELVSQENSSLKISCQ